MNLNKIDRYMQYMMPVGFKWHSSMQGIQEQYLQVCVDYKNKGYIFHFFIDNTDTLKFKIYPLTSELEYSGDFTLVNFLNGLKWVKSNQNIIQ